MTIFLELRSKFVFIHRRIISIISMLVTHVTNTAREHRCHVLTHTRVHGPRLRPVNTGSM